MYAPTPMKPTLTVLPRAATPPRALRAPSWRGALAAAALGAGALVGLGVTAKHDAQPSLLSQNLQAFQQRVTAGSGVPSEAPAADLLAQRYLAILAPETRQRIGDQVRAEQRAGLTPDGHDAFVMRRLALYEAALQQARTVTLTPPIGTAATL